MIDRPEIDSDTQAVLDSIAAGSTQADALKANNVDAKLWARRLTKEAALSEALRKAKECSAEALLDKILKLVATIDESSYQSDKVRLEGLKWLVTKLAPRVYGDRTQVEVSGQIQVVPVINVSVAHQRPDVVSIADPILLG